MDAVRACEKAAWKLENGEITLGEYEKLIASLRDVAPVVRCRDCKHRPKGTNRDDLEFPDNKCPCQCDDYWYSWKPSDDWFCGNGERKDGDHETD